MFNKTVLLAKDLSFRYPGNQTDSVKNLSLSVNEGCCLGIIGPNGAGKSTLISILCGLINENKGSITYFPESNEHSLNKLSKQAMIEKYVALIPQEYAFYQELSVKQNLEYFIALNGYSKFERKQVLDATLTQCSLSDFSDCKANNLSGGYKRRLNIAIALSKSPKIIFLDEPTVGIDPISRKEIIALLQSLKIKGITILYTSHILNEVEELCDEVLLLNSGKAISINNLSDSRQILNVELKPNQPKNDLLFIKQLGCNENKYDSDFFQFEVSDDAELQNKLTIISNNIPSIKRIHFTRNSIDQIYFDSLKAE